MIKSKKIFTSLYALFAVVTFAFVLFIYNQPPNISPYNEDSNYDQQFIHGEIEEIAKACLFLADPTKASFITGTHLTVDGGIMAKGGWSGAA